MDRGDGCINISVPEKFRGLLDPARYYVYYGGRGSAKSWSIAQYLICWAISQPVKILCARELQNSIAESVHSLLSTIISLYNLRPLFTVTQTNIIGRNGSQFFFKGLGHNIDSVKSTEGIDGVWIEEADKVSQNSWDILVPTIRKDSSKLIISFNPTTDDDPVWRMFILKNMPDAIVQKVSWRDNPHFPAVLRREMEHMRETDYDKYMHVWEGELRTISDAQVFKGKYVVKEFDTPDGITFYHGLDFGFANDPSAIVRAWISEGNLYIDREFYGFHVEIVDLPAMIRKILRDQEYQGWRFKGDCSRPETISYLANTGLNVTAAKKWQGSVEDGIEYLRSFRSIIIHPNCPRTIDEFRRYSYKIDRRTNDILPVVLDEYNHCIDALRYAIDDLIKRNVTIYDLGVI